MKNDRNRLSTRIIAGRHKGKKIYLPPKQVTRSSKARLRESLFNTLQFDLYDKNFVEMFGGSGSVGLEALSRGAKRAWFVELDESSFATLRENCRAIDAARCDYRRGDAFLIVPAILGEIAEKGEKTYLYIDPPFNIREGHEEIYEKVLAMMERIDPSVIEMIVVEHMSRYDFPEKVGSFVKKKFKKFGKSALSYYEPESLER